MYFDTCLMHGHEEYDVCVWISQDYRRSRYFLWMLAGRHHTNVKSCQIYRSTVKCVWICIWTYTYTPRSCWYYPSSELGMYVCACVCVCLREKRAKKRERERESERENKRECARAKQSHESESESESEREREREWERERESERGTLTACEREWESVRARNRASGSKKHVRVFVHVWLSKGTLAPWLCQNVKLLWDKNSRLKVRSVSGKSHTSEGTFTKDNHQLIESNDQYHSIPRPPKI